jgi:hypothetical protein
MRKHTLVLAALALVLNVATVAGVNAQTPALGASEPATISPEDLYRQVDSATLPVTQVDEPY